MLEPRFGQRQGEFASRQVHVARIGYKRSASPAGPRAHAVSHAGVSATDSSPAKSHSRDLIPPGSALAPGVQFTIHSTRRCPRPPFTRRHYEFPSFVLRPRAFYSTPLRTHTGGVRGVRGRVLSQNRASSYRYFLPCLRFASTSPPEAGLTKWRAERSDE